MPLNRLSNRKNGGWFHVLNDNSLLFVQPVNERFCYSYAFLLRFHSILIIKFSFIADSIIQFLIKLIEWFCKIISFWNFFIERHFLSHENIEIIWMRMSPIEEVLPLFNVIGSFHGKMKSNFLCVFLSRRDRFPFYKSNDDRWKNSVRHNLSINPHFRKGNKAPQGAGHLWVISTRDSEANILAWEHVSLSPSTHRQS